MNAALWLEGARVRRCKDDDGKRVHSDVIGVVGPEILLHDYDASWASNCVLVRWFGASKDAGWINLDRLEIIAERPLCPITIGL